LLQKFIAEEKAEVGSSKRSRSGEHGLETGDAGTEHVGVVDSEEPGSGECPVEVEAPVESSQLVESVAPRADDAEERASEADSGDCIGATEEARDGRAEPEEEPGSQEPETPREPEPAEGAVGEESEEKAVEEVTTSGDGEDEAVEVDARDLNDEVGKEEAPSPGEALDGASDDVASDDVEGEERVGETRDDGPQSGTAKEVVLSEPPAVSRTEEFCNVPIEHTAEEPSDALAEPCDEDPLTDELEHPTANGAASVPSIIGSEAKELPKEEAKGTVKPLGDPSHLLQTVMTDEEVKAAAMAGTQVLEPETAASSGSGEGAPQASGLDEVAAHLHDAAAKALQDGENRSSVAESVAHIVLEDSSHAKDASQYISEVVQHVAQDAGPTAAPASDQVTQPKVSFGESHHYIIPAGFWDQIPLSRYSSL
jgi:hypothetical protein